MIIVNENMQIMNKEDTCRHHCIIRFFGLEPGYVVGKGNYTAVPIDRIRLTHSWVRYKKYRELYEENFVVQLGGLTNHWVSYACDDAGQTRENEAQITIPVLRKILDFINEQYIE